MKYKILLLLSLPIFLVYLVLCIIVPIFKLGDKKKIKKGKEFFIIKDAIHADFLFSSTITKKIFKTKKKYTIIGWGDRKIFLETKKWSELKAEDFLKAFYGLNKTVLRVEFTNKIPKNKKVKSYKTNDIEILINHIKQSFVNKKITKKKQYYQVGEFYESKLKYNCITNCNNWVNTGLRKCRLSNRIWAPISFWL